MGVPTIFTKDMALILADCDYAKDWCHRKSLQMHILVEGLLVFIEPFMDTAYFSALYMHNIISFNLQVCKLGDPLTDEKN